MAKQEMGFSITSGSQPKQKNSGNQGQVQNVTTSKPETSPEIKVSVGSPKVTDTNFQIPVEVSIIRDKKMMPNISFVINRNLIKIKDGSTNNNGRCPLLLEFPLEDANQYIHLTFQLKDWENESDVVLTIPPHVKKSSEDPVTIELNSCVMKQNGETTVDIRVIKKGGVALNDALVNVFCHGKNKHQKTDETGHALFKVGKIEPGEKVKMIATVSGIAKACRLSIFNPRPAERISMSQKLQMFFCRISFLLHLPFIFHAVILIPVSLYILFSKSLDDRLNGNYGSDVLWILVLLVSLSIVFSFCFNIVFFIIKMRLRQVKEFIRIHIPHTSHAVAHDPAWEQVVAWAEDSDLMKQKSKVAVTNTVETTATDQAKPSSAPHWLNWIKIAAVALLGDFAVEFFEKREFKKHFQHA